MAEVLELLVLVVLAGDLLAVIRFELLILRLQVLQLVPVLLHLILKGGHTVLESHLLCLTCEPHVDVVIIPHDTASIKEVEFVPPGTAEGPLALEPFGEAQVGQLDHLSAESFVFLIELCV